MTTTEAATPEKPEVRVAIDRAKLAAEAAGDPVAYLPHVTTTG